MSPQFHHHLGAFFLSKKLTVDVHPVYILLLMHSLMLSMFLKSIPNILDSWLLKKLRLPKAKQLSLFVKYMLTPISYTLSCQFRLDQTNFYTVPNNTSTIDCILYFDGIIYNVLWYEKMQFAAKKIMNSKLTQQQIEQSMKWQSKG